MVSCSILHFKASDGKLDHLKKKKKKKVQWNNNENAVLHVQTRKFIKKKSIQYVRVLSPVLHGIPQLHHNKNNMPLHGINY